MFLFTLDSWFKYKAQQKATSSGPRKARRQQYSSDLAGIRASFCEIWAGWGLPEELLVPAFPCNDKVAARCPRLQLNANASSKRAGERVAINNHKDLYQISFSFKGLLQLPSIFMKAGIFFLSPKELTFHTGLSNQEADKVESPYIV